ncbi:MAG TPA: DinB family protein [Candidatus Eisenbacteria bacterium]|nr:DinB family protein [Candidatus Eisenbacteria bacterium]
MSNELQTFLNTWDDEAKKTVAMLRSLPEGQYDFRPDAGGRSLGELGWHLAETDAYMTYGIERGVFEMGVRPPGMERPKTVGELAPGFERVHADAVQRVKKLSAADLERQLMFFTGTPVSTRQILWSMLLHHQIHHRGQLSVLCRLAGGVAPAPYGPNREEMAKIREMMAATK